MVWKEADFFFFLVPPPSAVETETIGYSNFAERSLQRLFDLPTTYLHCTSTLFRHVATRGGIALSLFMQCTFFFIYIQKKGVQAIWPSTFYKGFTFHFKKRCYVPVVHSSFHGTRHTCTQYKLTQNKYTFGAHI